MGIDNLEKRCNSLIGKDLNKLESGAIQILNELPMDDDFRIKCKLGFIYVGKSDEFHPCVTYDDLYIYNFDDLFECVREHGTINKENISKLY
jgi:hypothetical protein